MISYIVACLLLVLAIAGVILRKTYYCLPAHELKRRARQHDAAAAGLYRAVAYGGSLRALLWLVIAAATAGGFVLLARVAPVWLSLAAVIGLLWVTYSWLPASRLSASSVRLTLLVTPAVVWLLSHLYPLLERVTGAMEKSYSAARHTGLFERSDLLKLIEQQAGQDDSRFSAQELEIAGRALRFDEYTAADSMTSLEEVKTILAGDTIGPVLINELYQSGQEFILVRETTDGPIVGVLDAKRLQLHTSGLIRDLMQPTVYYLHEKDTLSEALQAFFATKAAMLVVLNNAGEYLGIISLHNVLQQLIGQPAKDAFDQYADPAAVAARHTSTRPAAVPKEAIQEETAEPA